MPNQYEYSRKFFDRWYRPDNCIVLVVGDARHKEVVELRGDNTAVGSRASRRPTSPPSRQTAERRRDLEWKGVTQPYLYIGYHVPGFDPKSRDIAAARRIGRGHLLASQSALSQAGLGRSPGRNDYGRAQFHRDPTLFTIMARLHDAADMAAIEKEVYQALAAAADRPIDAQQLADIKSHMRDGFATSLDSTNAVARARGLFLELTGDPDSLDQIYATYEQVTPEDVQRVAKNSHARKPHGGHAAERKRRGGEKANRESRRAAAKPAAAKPSKPAPTKQSSRGPIAEPAPEAGGKTDVKRCRREKFAAGDLTYRLPRRLARRPAGQGGFRRALTARMLSEGGSDDRLFQSASRCSIRWPRDGWAMR